MSYDAWSAKTMRIPEIEHPPTEWHVVPARKIFREIQNPNTANAEANLLSLSYGKIVSKDITTNDGLLPASFETYQMVMPSNIVLRLTDLQNDKRSLRVGYVGQRGIITSAYVALLCDKTANSRYFYYVLHAYDTMKIFYGLGGGVRQTMTFDDLKWLPVPEPPMEVQSGIADFLDRETAKADLLVVKYQRLLDLLEEERIALITRTVTKGLDPNVPTKRSGIEWIGDIPVHWKSMPLKWLVNPRITDGPHETPQLLDDGVPFVSAESVKDGTIDFDLKRGYISEELHKEFSRKCSPKPFDIFLVKSGNTTGACAILREHVDFSIWSPLALIRADLRKVLPEYLFLALNSRMFQDAIKVTSSYGTQPNIGMGVLENIRIPVPPMKEQHQMVAFIMGALDKVRDLRDYAQRAIPLAKNHRSALIIAAVTGQINVGRYGPERPAVVA